MTATGGNKEVLTLSLARAPDCDLLFEWTNALRTCGFALSGDEPLDRATHAAWFAARLCDPDCRIWIIEHSGTPAGVVRLERETGKPDDAVAVSVFIAQEARRSGLASEAIERALRDAVRELGTLTALARVRPENSASLRLFDSLGFTPAERHTDHVVLLRQVSE